MPTEQIPVKIQTRIDQEQRESENLASYGMRSMDSAGRVHTEEEHPYRTAYQRDRDRIVHSSAFRRLEYKTQVFVNIEGDYYRTRLTHSLEEAGIARSVARALGLNEDLTEAISLAHDLGHPPFGHAGEDALRALMKDCGGFDHNLQGLRVVELLEERSPQYPGLNLSWEVREGINKGRCPLIRPGKSGDSFPQPSLETQVVDVADEIAYDNHDLDDGLTSGLLREEDLLELDLWREAHNHVAHEFGEMDASRRKYQIVRYLINRQITDLLHESAKRLAEFKIKTPDEARRWPQRVVSFSPSMTEIRKPLRRLLLDRMYRHYRVIRMANKAQRFIRDLFQVYLEKPEQLPPTTRRRMEEQGTERAICDYIAGMTDRYALTEHQKLFDPYTRV
ncbi:MAG: deoxyguanosinetriphosphate triphosphohydrolase [Candidatus Omnitrophica bacterium]|nr:deoxyguanosinetriphosphate triphosphohydrolase [Candidatus Omnitrophota bacterium]